ncbi:MAG: GTPase Era [Lentisphaeria bacterium]
MSNTSISVESLNVGGSENEILNCGIIAIVGRANVGKSTLLNRLLEEKVSIVSDVAQTTRNLIRAILTEKRGQLVFIDTPGMHRAASELGKIMNRMARQSIEGADIVLLMLDGSTTPRDEDEGWMRKLAKQEAHCIFALNKADAGKNHARKYAELWEQIASQRDTPPAVEWCTISALTGHNVTTLLDQLFERVPKGPQLFPDDLLTDFPRRWNISDIIREKLFSDLYAELPHDIDVGISDITEHPDHWDVYATIFVNRPTQKGIVIGHKGRLLRKVRRQAEKELKEMYGLPVKLELWVKVEKNWMKNFWILRELGYQ